MPASPPPPVRVRPARPEELDAVGRLTVAAYAADVPPGSTYAQHLADAGGRARHARLLVAVDPEERLLGTATLVVGGGRWAELAGPGDAELRMLGVDRAARRRGVGEALLRATLAEARAAGCRRFVLSTLPTMTAAHRLYERAGLRRAPALDHTPAPGIDLLAYALDL
ncbi:MAG TPA: GNAT family N-acetyltransferase [Actinomycetes bacterium]|jgi:ribosomal protein S18 acetylase RimI-like enzyme|nr:GNAT family N-acetyltransferase [Actinomycetes bacterium]